MTNKYLVLYITLSNSRSVILQSRVAYIKFRTFVSTFVLLWGWIFFTCNDPMTFCQQAIISVLQWNYFWWIILLMLSLPIFFSCDILPELKVSSNQWLWIKAIFEYLTETQIKEQTGHCVIPITCVVYIFRQLSKGAQI